MRASLIATLAITSAVGCSDDSATGVPGQRQPPTLAIISGSDQIAEVGAELPAPLVVELRDSVGAPVPGIFVRFVNLGIPRFDSSSTDPDGRASVRWTLGTVAGMQAVEAHAVIPDGPAARPVSFMTVARPGAVANIRVTAKQTLARPRARLDTIVASVADRFDNLIAGAPLTWTVERGEGSVEQLDTKTDVQGFARALWTLGPAVGENGLLVSVGDVVARATAIASDGFPATTVVTGSSHTCALTPVGEAYCWGWNVNGQLGSGEINATPRSIPAKVAGTLTFTSLSASGERTCGLTKIGDIYCWGLYDGSRIAGIPVRIGDTSGFVAITVGIYHGCALSAAGVVYCWGDTSLGQTGVGGDRSMEVGFGTLIQTSLQPIQSSGGPFVSIAATDHSTCAVATTGLVSCWGGNMSGELGVTTAGVCRFHDPYYWYDRFSLPCNTTPSVAAVPAVPPNVAVAADSTTVCALSRGGDAWCWGTNGSPRPIVAQGLTSLWVLGDVVCGSPGETVLCWWVRQGVRPTARPFGDDVALVALTKGDAHACGLSRDSPPFVYCWGDNGYGQLGDGSLITRRAPAPVLVAPSPPS